MLSTDVVNRFVFYQSVSQSVNQSVNQVTVACIMDSILLEMIYTLS